MTNPFFSNCIRDVIQVEQKSNACLQKWYTSILLTCRRTDAIQLSFHVNSTWSKILLLFAWIKQRTNNNESQYDSSDSTNYSKIHPFSESSEIQQNPVESIPIQFGFNPWFTKLNGVCRVVNVIARSGFFIKHKL